MAGQAFAGLVLKKQGKGMRKRTRILAGVLAGCLLMGQTVFAEEGELSFCNSGTDTATLRASQAELPNNAEISVNNLDAE